MRKRKADLHVSKTRKLDDVHSVEARAPSLEDHFLDRTSCALRLAGQGAGVGRGDRAESGDGLEEDLKHVGEGHECPSCRPKTLTVISRICPLASESDYLSSCQLTQSATKGPLSTCALRGSMTVTPNPGVLMCSLTCSP